MELVKKQSINTIRAFLEVLQTQQALFAEAGPGLSQLGQTLEKLATDQFEEMASAIRAFMKAYPPIRDRVVLVSNKGANVVGNAIAPLVVGGSSRCSIWCGRRWFAG